MSGLVLLTKPSRADDFSALRVSGAFVLTVVDEASFRLLPPWMAKSL